MDLKEILILISFIFVVILLISFFLYKVFKIKPKKESKIDLTEIMSLFGKDNIINVERKEQRVRIEVKDLNLVLLEELKEYTNGIFTIGNKVVATFKENTEQVIKSLEDLIK